MFRQTLRVALAACTFALNPSAWAIDDVPTSELLDEEFPEVTITYKHGFRVGYSYVNLPRAYFDSPLAQLKSPHLFTMGYEVTQTMDGGGWLDVITVQNITLAGIDQNVFIPSFNALVGFEILDQIQLGVGPSLTPLDPNEKYVRLIAAAGWTPQAGAFNVPVHFLLIPDPEGHWRVGATVGVNWGGTDWR